MTSDVDRSCYPDDQEDADTMDAAMITTGYTPRDRRQFSIMVRHFRGAFVLDEIVHDRELFVGDLAFDEKDADAAVELVATEKGWR